MRRGRAARLRKQHRRRQGQGDPQADVCADLRKWMASRCSKHYLASTFNLVPFHFTETGRGLKTKTAVAPGTVIVSVPQSLLVTPCLVLNSHIGLLVKRWSTFFTPHQLLALFLIIERNRGIDSDWHPFISSLPTEYTLPYYFTTQELSFLPPHVSLIALRLVQRSRHAHKQVLRFCSSHWKDADCWASWERFRWAWCSVASRSIFLPTEEGVEQFVDLDLEDENNVAMCPYLDLINHTSTARVNAGLNRLNGKYEIVTYDSYQPHDQVFIGYGPHDNAKLFLYYGFTLPNNIHNSVCFSVDDFVELRDFFKVTCWDQKLAALRKNNLHRGLSCTMEGASWNFMSAFKILAMDWAQLQKCERVLTGEQLPPAVVTCARRMAKHLVAEALAKSKALLAKQQTGDQLSAHSNIALCLALDEVSILTVALQDVS